MRIPVVALFVAVTSFVADPASAQLPQLATEQGVPFPLPQSTNSLNRRAFEGESNAVTASWDGRLLMYAYTDSASTNLWANRPTGTIARGFVFATFDPALVTDNGGRPNFTNCFGTPFPRFAEVDDLTAPNGTQNTYPAYTGYTGGTYPWIGATAQGVGSLGELSLHHLDYLSNNLYRAPDGDPDLPATAYNNNPFRSDSLGGPDLNGAYQTYIACVTFQDIPKFWMQDGTGTWRWQGSTNPNDPFARYELGIYPNHFNLTVNPELIKRNGIAKLRIIVNASAHTVTKVEVITPWKPFRVYGDGTWTSQSGVTLGWSVPSNTEMWADNFEPTLTQDGHLMVGKGSPNLCTGIGSTSHIVFYFNQTAFGETGWNGPYELHKLHLFKDIDVAGRKIGERYPIARHPFKDYDGKLFGDTNGDGLLSQTEINAAQFEGGYTWLSPDGRYLLFACYSAGVGMFHPQTTLLQDGGGISNRGHVSIVGSVTGWQMWRIDNAVENPSRHMFTGWDQDSRTTHQRNLSFGFGPGFWQMLKGATDLPLRDDGHLKLQLVNSQRLLYYELDLSPYQERDYGFYLPMSELIYLYNGDHREVDWTRTPDLSGNGHVGTLENNAQFPCEYFELPKLTNSAPGLYGGALLPTDIHPSWGAGDCVTSMQHGTLKYWARIADGPSGVCDATHVPPIWTLPFDGLGNKHDMDSDVCWGRFGQAIFFKDTSKVRISNSGTPKELNPGTSVSGAAHELTASLWVCPVQPRTTRTVIFSHNLTISLTRAGGIEAAVTGWPTLASPTSVAQDGHWTHIAATWKDTSVANQSELRLYINGDELAASPLVMATDQLPLSTADITVGCISTCGQDPTSAVLLLDEVALKNSAMTAAEIWNAAQRTLPTTTWNNTNLPTVGLPFHNDTDGRVPTGNAYSANVAQLGADLFRDVQLSGSKQMSCATCHNPANAFTDGQKVATGNNGQALLRNTPTIYNRRFSTAQFWDARAVDLEDQAADPIFEPTEMNLSWNALYTYLTNDSDYSSRFFSTMGVSTITESDVRKAIATYMRAPTASWSNADKFADGQTNVLSAQELRGRGLFFGRARCSGCHNGPNFTDERLWTTGTFRSDHTDDGAYNANAGVATAGRARFLGAFKTPTLRELSRTGPYFHDGHAATLTAVVNFYNDGGVRQDGMGYALSASEHDIDAEEINRKLGLASNEIDDLVAYLVSLTATDVNNGPTGLNVAPVCTIVRVTTSSSGGTTTKTVIVDVTDQDGQGDLDTSMNWTLELNIGGVLYHWSQTTIANIANGYRVTVNVTPPPSNPTVKVRAADHHGLWGAWVTH